MSRPKRKPRACPGSPAHHEPCDTRDAPPQGPDDAYGALPAAVARIQTGAQAVRDALDAARLTVHALEDALAARDAEVARCAGGGGVRGRGVRGRG